MKILFTGASSFTGFWFIKELAKRGHEVTAIFQKPLDQYTAVRALRIQQLLPLCEPVFSCPFGSDLFLKLIAVSSWDCFCHHAADVTNYKSPSFDWEKALHANTLELPKILDILKTKGCKKGVLTGTVFEPGEGAGSDGLRAVSPYGLSKGLTAEVFRFYAQMAAFPFGKFVIPNPFGPFEEKRFTSFLMEKWWALEEAVVNTPDYVRDNIHVSLLAKAYGHFVEQEQTAPWVTYRPSGYVESQGAFTARFAHQMQVHLALPCAFKLQPQSHFLEPKIRHNTEPVNASVLGWEESTAWEELAKYYQTYKDR